MISVWWLLPWGMAFALLGTTIGLLIGGLCATSAAEERRLEGLRILQARPAYVPPSLFPKLVANPGVFDERDPQP